MSPAEITKLLRLAADEELTPEQVETLEAHLAAHSEDRDFIQFERRLRTAVGRVMGAEKAPVALRSEVAAQIKTPAEPLRLVGTAAHQSRRVFVPSGLAAGFIVLVGAAVVIGVMGRAEWFSWFRPTQIQVGGEGGTLGFPVEEHQLCATDLGYAQRKFTMTTEPELRTHLVSDLNWAVDVPDLRSFGYEFRDAGDCNVGGGAVESVHLRYTDGASTVSVWIEHSLPSELTHSARLEEGRAYYVIPTNRQSKPDETIAYYAWRQGEFVYRLVPASVKDARHMAIALGMPESQPEAFN